MEHMTKARLTSLRQDSSLSPSPKCDIFGINERYARLVQWGYKIDVRGPYLTMFRSLRSWSIVDTLDGRLQNRLSQALYLVSLGEADILQSYNIDVNAEINNEADVVCDVEGA
jgi:hypothetical protein